MRKRPSKRRIWARFMRGGDIAEADWLRHNLSKRNKISKRKSIFEVVDIFAIKLRQRAKEIRSE